MLSSVFWGAVLRVAQAALQATPFIFTCLCITGLFHRLMGQKHTRWLFGSNSVASLFQSWLIGMLLGWLAGMFVGWLLHEMLA